MPNSKYKSFDDPTRQKGDTVIGPDGKKYIVEKSPNKVVSDTISRLTNPYKGQLSGSLTQWDVDHPRKSVDRTASVLDKQDVSKGVKLAVDQGYQSYVQPAFTVALDMLESLENAGTISKDEVYNILSPKPKSDDPFSNNSAVDEWVKKYDPDYFKGTIHDKNVYNSVKNYKKAVSEKGADFFISRTNINRQVKYDANGNVISPPKYGSAEDMLSTVPQDWNLEATQKENYTSQVLNRIADYAKNNYSLSPVSNAISKQSLGPLMASAQIYSMNMQDVKDFRIKTKEKIVNSMYNSLKDRDDVLREFGTPVFDENNKFVKYNTQNLRFQLDKSFDEAGNFDPDYIPYTNYKESLNKYDYNERKRKEALGELGFKNEVPTNTDFDELDFFAHSKQNATDYNMDFPYQFADPKEMSFEELEDYRKKNNLTNLPVIQHSKTWDEQSNPQTGNLMGSNPTFSVAYSGNTMGKVFADEFEKAVENIYKDKDDRNILGLGYNNIPFLQSVGAGGTGIGSNALSKKIKLSAGKNSDAIVIWKSFINDWDGNDIKNKVNGADRLISFEGAGQVGYEASLGEDEYVGESSEKGIKLVNNFLEWIKSHKDTEFDMEAYKYAAGSFDKSAMRLDFPEKFLKEQVKTGVINDTDKELILKNGATIIANQGDFNNELMLAQRTPLQAHIDYRGNYTWRHPSNLTSYTIEKSGDRSGDYRTTATWYGYDEENPGRLKILRQQKNSITKFGDNIDKALNDAINGLSEDVNIMLND
jgi:hypothetical protein